MVTLSDGSQQLQLKWLITIRWTALVSYAAILSVSIYLLGFEADAGLLAVVIALGVTSNIGLGRLAHSRMPHQMLMGCAIALDVMLLAGLLFFCGGFTNPFSMMFLVQVTLAAFFLDARWTWSIFLLAAIAFLGLFFFHIAVPQFEMHNHMGHVHGTAVQHGSGFSLHLHGMLVAFVVIGSIISFFLTRMSKELSELRQSEMQRRQLLSLATITAGAAHELATPLATVSLIADEIASHPETSGVDRSDVDLMRRELERCAGILSKMRGGGAELQGEAPVRFSLASILDELAEVSERVMCSAPQCGDLEMYSLREALLASLRALAKNGLQADPAGQIEIAAKISGDDVTFTVRDQGCGMSAEVQQRCGEPFFTSKAPGEGMGLGVYLTKLFVSQMNGEFRLTSSEGQGTEVAFTIPCRLKA
jgi:two-component system sensor histidine kinase RegB